MKSFKFLIIVAILLVIINCVLLASLWFTKYHMSPPQPPQQTFEYLIKELKLTPQQIKQYDTLRRRHFEAIRRLNDQNFALRDELFENIKTPALDTHAVDSLTRKIGANVISADTVTLYHFRKLRAMLNKQQQTHFDSVIVNALHTMGGPPPPMGIPPGKATVGSQPQGAAGHDRLPPSQRNNRHVPPGGRTPRPGMDHPYGPPPDGMGPPPGGPPDRDLMPPPGGPRPGMRPPGGPPPGWGPPPGVGPPPGGGPPPGY